MGILASSSASLPRTNLNTMGNFVRGTHTGSRGGLALQSRLSRIRSGAVLPRRGEHHIAVEALALCAVCPVRRERLRAALVEESSSRCISDVCGSAAVCDPPTRRALLRRLTAAEERLSERSDAHASNRSAVSDLWNRSTDRSALSQINCRTKDAVHPSGACPRPVP